MKEVNLAPFIGNWCEAIETVTYGESGTYDIIIKRISDGVTLFSYNNNSIRMWKTNADFVRPKWGIYRSLLNAQDLRNEEVLFADFSIEEIPLILSTNGTNPELNIQLYPNPSVNSIQIDGIIQKNINYKILNLEGKIILEGKVINNQIEISDLMKGVYFISFQLDENVIVKKFVKE